MPNLKVFEKPAVKTNNVYLKLKQEGTYVAVVAVDKYGEEYDGGSLIYFSTDGTIVTTPGVNNQLGFSLNDAGEIKVI